MRLDNRKLNELRPVKITAEVIRYAEGSVQIDMGNTRVICTATLDPMVPKWLQGSGQGWVGAEYGMLPRSTHTRISREKAMSSGRTQEISRLIGRSLRAAVDLKALGERQIQIDCDVIQADGGTRTASITGAYVAVALALRKMQNLFPSNLLKGAVAAISVGIVKGVPSLDLHYDDDKRADVDMNVVKLSDGRYVELQGTAEQVPFDRAQLDKLMQLADSGIDGLFEAQKKILG